MSILDKLIPTGKSQARTELELLMSGCTEQLYPVLNNLYLYTSGEVRSAAKACTEIIGKRNGRELVQYLYQFRNVYYDRGIKEKNYKKYKALCGDDFPSVLAAGVCHCNGFIRMNSVKLMAEYPKYLPLMLYLYNDWVANVRLAAEEAFMSAAEKADIAIIALSYAELACLKRSERRNAESLAAAETLLKRRLTTETDNSAIAKILVEFPQKDCARIFSALLTDKILSAESAEHILSLNKNFFRYRAMLLYIRNYELSPDKLMGYTNSRTPAVRLLASQRLIELYGLWDGAERLLIDKSKAIRELMQFYFPKLRPETDIAAYCKSELPKPQAIMALGELHCTDEEETFRGYVNSDDAKIAAAGIYSLCMITDDKYSGLYYDMISDPRSETAKMAYKAFVSFNGSKEPSVICEDILRHKDNDVLCRRYAYLLCRPSQGIWEAMPQLITLYSFPNEAVRLKIQNAAEKRSCYFIGSPQCKNEIKEALSRSKDIPAELKETILSQIGERS